MSASKNNRGERFVSTPKSGRLKLDPEQRRKLEKDVASGKAPAGAEKLLEKSLPQVHLARVRLARHVTQASVASRLGVQQGRVSGIETRPDMRISTLKRYVEALDGNVKIEAVFPNGEIVDLLADD